MHTILTPTTNGPIIIEYHTLNTIMSSASKTEMRMVYLNGKATIPVLISLEEMGHSQVPKPLKTDNNTAEGFLKNYSEKKVKGF